MKYKTKEWYIAMQRSGLHVSFKSSERAATFSEEYFKELYAAAEEDRIEFMEKVSKRSEERRPEHEAPFEVPLTRVDGSPTTTEEQEFVLALREALAEAERNAPPIVVDVEAEKAFVRNQYEHRLRYLEYHLPEAIKTKVADMRVLALYYAAPEVLDEIKAFSKANNQAVDSAFEAYRAEFDQNFPVRKPPFYRRFNLHDDKVLSLRQEGKDLLLLLNTTFWQRLCRFVDGELISCDGHIEGALWLYDEIYPLEDERYEIHGLLHQHSDLLTADCMIYVVIRCRDVQISGVQAQT